MKPKNPPALVDCFGWPLPPPDENEKLTNLVERVKAANVQLESRAVSGDVEAMREFESQLAQMGRKYLHLLSARSKFSGTSFNGQSVIEQLLETADDTIECLGWVAKNRSRACERFAENRLTWPGFISSLPSIEKKSQALKDHLPLGRKYNHYHSKTVADKLFKAARWIIKYVSDGDDWRAMFCFGPFEWLERDEYRQAMMMFRQRLGPLTRSNWAKWKPVFARCSTLIYGPPRERWKLVPDSPMPMKLRRKYSVLTVTSYKDDLWIAIRLGVTNEWFQHYVATHKITLEEKAKLQIDVQHYAEQNPHPCLMDIEPDDTLKGIQRRVEDRDGGWGDYKAALLRKCKNLLPA